MVTNKDEREQINIVLAKIFYFAKKIGITKKMIYEFLKNNKEIPDINKNQLNLIEKRVLYSYKKENEEIQKLEGGNSLSPNSRNAIVPYTYSARSRNAIVPYGTNNTTSVTRYSGSTYVTYYVLLLIQWILCVLALVFGVNVLHFYLGAYSFVPVVALEATSITGINPLKEIFNLINGLVYTYNFRLAINFFDKHAYLISGTILLSIGGIIVLAYTLKG